MNIFFILLLSTTCTKLQQRKYLSSAFSKTRDFKFYQYRKSNSKNMVTFLKMQIVQEHFRNIVDVIVGNYFSAASRDQMCFSTSWLKF